MLHPMPYVHCPSTIVYIPLSVLNLTGLPNIETQIRKQVDCFETIDLKGLDEVSLLNRVDTKYIFNISRLPDLLKCLQAHYRVLEVNVIRICGYDSLYFDTSDHKFYLAHHNKKGNRYKLRQRHYQSTDLSFLEVKFKTNKKRTIKYRFKRSEITDLLNVEDVNALSQSTGMDADGLQPMLWVFFKRMTFANRQMDERLTLDFNLHFKSMEGKTIGCPDYAIAEVKQSRSNGNSAVRRCLKRMRIPPSRISKYCLGSVMLFGNEIKHNRFKAKLRKLQKIKETKCC